MFRMGIAGEPWFGQPVGPITVTVSREEIDRDPAKVLRKLPVPKGWTGSYPYVVKVDGEGEYLVNADGTVQLWNARQSRWEPPQPFDNQSLFAQMFPGEQS